MMRDNKEDKDPKKYDIVVGVSFVTKVMVGIGLLFVIASNIPMGAYDNIRWMKVVKKISETIGTTIFSAGLVSVIVEISSITEIVKKALRGMLSEQFPFEKLSKARLDEIYKQIAFLRLDDNSLKVKDMEDSPYVLEPELLELSKGLYYEYHKAKFVITPDNKKNVFCKHVEFDYKIVNRLGLENSAKFTVTLICQQDDLSMEDVKSYFHIKLFKIEESDKIKVSGRRTNEKNLTEEAMDYLNITEVEPQAHSMYKYEIHFEYALSNKLCNSVKLIYEYQIPQSDITQSYKLNYPSKALEHEISIAGDGWEITGDAFTAFYFPDMYDKEYRVAQTIPTSIRVDFRDWAVPGAGYIATFIKK